MRPRSARAPVVAVPDGLRSDVPATTEAALEPP